MTVLLVIWREEDASYLRYRDYSEHVWKPALVHAKVIPPPKGLNAARKPPYETTGREGPHQYRHYYASVSLADGCSIVDLAVYLGHHDPSVTLRIYGHLMQNSHERARGIIDRRMPPRGRCPAGTRASDHGI